ncbi:MAG: cell envelope integrity protein CreD [Betaproteobacteria bacterium]|nr:cell envelope integrity protein CreD [Betaproteobacteria bacterium]
MQKNLVLRVLTIGLLMAILMIPLSMIQGVVHERAGNQKQVVQAIAASLAGPQAVSGPILLIPYVERQLKASLDERGREIKTPVELERRALFVPERVDITASADTESRHRGLYKALVYRSRIKVSAEFVVPAHLGTTIAPGQLIPGKGWLAWCVTDVRGLGAAPRITWAGAAIEAGPGTRLEALGSGFHADLPVLDISAPARYTVAAEFELAGTSDLGWVPVGKANRVDLKAGWPHPNFGGGFLPVKREVSDHGFSATWEVSHLSSRNVGLLSDAANKSVKLDLDSFEVAFIEPVNLYLLAERATKYGVLFIVLTFGGFFLYETLRRWRLHPLQYGLVGLALAVFFLLLIALSEHIAFVWAYVAAAAAGVSLITYYLAHVLGGWRPALLFCAMLSMLYAALFGLLQSEDNALVMGALLVFAMLAAIMVLTRRIDWYAVGAPE